MKTQTPTHQALSLKRTLSLILVISMLLSASSSLAFAGEKKDFNYLVLGASETNGYGLNGFIDPQLKTNDFYLNPDEYLQDASIAAGFENTSTRAYPMLIREKLKEKLGRNYDIKLYQYAQSGMRYEELRFLLDPDYEGDGYTKWRFYDGTDKTAKWFPAEYMKLDGSTYKKSLSGLREKYTDAIINADLITLDLGINSFVTFVFNALLYNMFDDVDFSNLLDEETEAKFSDIRNKINEAIIELSEGNMAQEDLDNIYAYTDVIPYAYVSYCINFDACVKIIRDLNPKAEIVIVGMPKISGMENVSIGDISLSVDKIFTMLLQSANMYSKYLSPYADLYYYADVAEVDVPTLAEDLLAYNGEFLYSEEDWSKLNADDRKKKELILNELTECFDIYDSSLQVRSTLTKAIKADSMLSSEAALSRSAVAGKYANDMIARGMQYALGSESLDIISLISGNSMTELEDDLMDLAKGIFEKSIALMERELKYSEHTELSDFDAEAFVEECLQDETTRSVLSFYVSAYIGNSFFSHPNEDGHAAMADVIFNAYKNKINERSELKKALIALPYKLAKSMAKSSQISMPGEADEQQAVIADQTKLSVNPQAQPVSGRQEKIKAAIESTNEIIKSSIQAASKRIEHFIGSFIKH